MTDSAGITRLSPSECKWLYRIYLFYIILSLGVHIYLLRDPIRYFANDRMMGIFKNPNQLGFFLVAFYLFYILKIRRVSGLQYYMITAILFATVILTGSRSALMAIGTIHITDRFINKQWIYLMSLLVFSSAAIVYLQFTGNAKLIAFISRREVSSISEGNMRGEIFNNIITTNTLAENCIGKDASIGTNGMIYEQKKNNKPIVWLDSMLNVFLYNWGFLGLGLFFCLAFYDLIKQIPVVNNGSLIIILYLIASCFFVIGDFFPFMVVFLKNSLRE
jgi:hypothetical protein